jgi:putative ABC transport system permease protein
MTGAPHSPPRAARWIALRLARFNRDHALCGDMEELYAEIQTERGRFVAAAWYWGQSLVCMVTCAKLHLVWSTLMIINYLKITFRHLLKHKTFSLINIVGLAMSMAICLMIIVFIEDHKSSDRFHENRDRIMHMYTTDANFGWDVDGWACTVGTMAPYLKEHFPFIEDTVRLRKMYGSVLQAQTAIPLSGLYAEPSFLSVFSFPLRAGDPRTALQKPFSIIISEETALTLFGRQDPMNQTITLEDLGDFTVTGVLKEQDVKSHFVFDALVSFATVVSLENSKVMESDVNGWSSFTRYYTYVLLKEGTDPAMLVQGLPRMETALIPAAERERFGFSMQPLLDINLGINLANAMPGVNPRLDIFIIPFLAGIVMFLACFNYIILSIARSLRRTREIGLRKVIGSSRGQVIKLFLSETFVITIMALVVACVLILWMIPAFNDVDAVKNAGQQINLEAMKEFGIYLVFLLFAVFVSLVAGLYPAIYLSSFRPVNALQGVSGVKGSSHLRTRKILMGIQFGVSLAAVMLIVYFYQLHVYWLTFDRGIATENVVNVALMNVNPDTFRNEIRTNSSVAGVSFSSSVPIYGGFDIAGLRKPAMDQAMRSYQYSVDPEFIPNFGLELVAGRNFSSGLATDETRSVILNETAVRRLALGTPLDAIGKTLVYGESSEVIVAGVLADFNFRHLENAIDPLMLINQPTAFRYANVRYLPGRKAEIAALIDETWKRFDPVHPAWLEFLDDAAATFNGNIEGTIVLSAWGSGLIILIALLGLLGMATYTTELKAKEIGIRKVLGITTFGAVYLLSRSYLRLIGVAALFAIPAGYFAADAMLEFFAFRPELSLWVAPAALAFILGLAMLTISSQIVKVAHTNPVETMRIE